MAKRTRHTYTDAQRQKILAAAQTEGLTAEAVQKRFGVKPVTYYTWRQKMGSKGLRGRRPASWLTDGNSDVSAQVRAGVQHRVREIMPSIVREEVEAYLATLFGQARRRGRPARP